jgi:hypothetical protein
VKNELPEAFAQLEGIESASLENPAGERHAPGRPENFWNLRLVPEFGSPMWLFAFKELTEGLDAQSIAAFYSDNIAQRVRARRGECIFCGACCDCAEPALRKSV